MDFTTGAVTCIEFQEVKRRMEIKGNKGNNTGTNHLGIVWVGVALVLGGVSKRQHIRELRGNPIDLLRRALI